MSYSRPSVAMLMMQYPQLFCMFIMPLRKYFTYQIFSSEKSIPLPRNKATELGTTFGAEPQAQVQRGLLTSQLKEAEESEGVPPAIRSGVALSYLRTQSLKPPTILKPEDRSYEPATAIVDATCHLHYDLQNPAARKIHESNIRKPIESGETSETEKKRRKKSAGWMSKFIKKLSAKSTMNKPCKGREPNKSLPPVKNEEDKIFVRHATCCMCSFVTDRLGLPSPESCQSDLDSSTEIHIPYLFTEYKRDQRGEHQAFHQAQMYVTFGLEFLAALGIKDEPVWALVTSGTKGTIIMAWKSTAKSSRKPNSVAIVSLINAQNFQSLMLFVNRSTTSSLTSTFDHSTSANL